MERVVECIKTMLELIADVSVLYGKYICVRPLDSLFGENNLCTLDYREGFFFNVLVKL